MSKFCSNCGTPLAEGAKFCAGCGAAVAAPAAPVQEPVAAPVQEPVYTAPQSAPAYNYQPQQPVAPAPAPKKKKTGLIITALLVVVALIVAAVLIPWSDIFGGSDDDGDKSGSGSGASAGAPADAVNLYYDALYEGKSAMIKNLAPKEYWDWAKDAFGVTAEQVAEYFEDELKEDRLEDLVDEFGKDFTVTFTKEAQEDLDSEDLERIAHRLNAAYGVDEDDVTKGVRMAGTLIAKGSEDEDEDDVDDLYALQIDGRWYYVYVTIDGNSAYASFPVEGLVVTAGNEIGGSYDEDDSDIALPDQNQGTAAPAPNPPATEESNRDEQVEEMRDIDPVVKLQNIWDAYLDSQTLFYAVGGDPDHRVDDAPALHDTYYRENLMGTYMVPEDWLDSIEKVATFTDGYVANDFCSAVYVLDNALSDFQVEDFMSAMGQNLLNIDWEGYAPERIVVGLIEDGCVLVAFGTEERIVPFTNAARGAYGIQTVYETYVD